MGCETSGFSDPAVPWLWLWKAEIKAAFRAPSLSLSQGEHVLSGEDPSFNSVGERNPWSHSLKQCVFTRPEGNVGRVTQGSASGGLLRCSLQTNQKRAGKWAAYHSTVMILESHLSSHCYISWGLILLYCASNRPKFQDFLLETLHTEESCVPGFRYFKINI